ncbi:MAG: DUF4846 domain-containing protein [Candidatus Wallbacteria bacterium]|nr:DUF4846 domain-containing protein [Candidatus Wallbacteria bacterium]
MAFCLQAENYPWLPKYDRNQSIGKRFSVPFPYQRVKMKTGSFGDWIRNLPLKPENARIRLYTGKLLDKQDLHAAVLDLDLPAGNYLRGPSIAPRLLSEYLFSIGRYWEIEFYYTEDRRIDFNLWRTGARPVLYGDHLRWNDTEKEDSSYDNFRRYLDYCLRSLSDGSLEFRFAKSPKLRDLQIGDIFLSGGYSGHAVMVVDMAKNTSTGEKIFLLAQGFTPTQEFHILKNTRDHILDPWYSLKDGEKLLTPECVFEAGDLMRVVEKN